MELLAKEPFEQIALVATLYEKTKNTTIQKSLKKWCRENLLLDAYETISK